MSSKFPVSTNKENITEQTGRKYTPLYAQVSRVQA